MAFVSVSRHGPVTEIVVDPARRGPFAGRPVFPFRCYFVDGLLIDTGPPRAAGVLAPVFAELGVKAVVNTHHHEDHAGQNAAFNAGGIVPLAHPLAVERLARLPRIQAYRHWVWGEAEASETAPLPEVVETPRHRFRVVPTPGHCEDHVCLVEESEGWVFAGDLYLGDRLKLLRREEDPLAMRASLERVLEGPVGTVFCAHKGVVKEGRAALTRKRNFLTGLQEAALERRARGETPERIARALLGPEDALYYISGGDFSRRALIEALLPGWAGPAPVPPPRRGGPKPFWRP